MDTRRHSVKWRASSSERLEFKKVTQQDNQALEPTRLFVRHNVSRGWAAQRRSLGGQDSMLDEPVHLESYNPAWEHAFLVEQKRLLNELKLAARSIEHIGSTAVPGLLAKPIVDIMVGVHPFPPPEAWSQSLVALGYEALGEAGVPGRLYFRRRGPISYNVHVVEDGDVHWVNNIALRDYLRKAPEVAKRYASTKRAAIAAGATTLLKYSEAKGRMLEELLREALA
jgi:GrpB-like predicted nucleotidyltransferase (UPF0157 family)